MTPVFLHIQLYQYLHICEQIQIIRNRRGLQMEGRGRKDICQQFSIGKDNLIMKSLQVNMQPGLES